MAGYIRGITISFGADTSQLNSALKKTQGTINKTQAELKQINRALKFNPGNTTLLRQKFELLQQSVKETSLKLKQLKDMQRQMDAAGVDKTSAQYRQLEREIVKTESQLKNAQNALKQFGSVGKQQALAVGNAFKTAGNKIKSAGRTITTTMSVYGVAGIYAGSRLIEMSEKQAQAEQKLAEIYKSRMGVGKKAVQSTLKLASAQQKLGVVGDEVQLAGAQQLATYAKYPSTVNTMLPALNNLLVQQKGLNGTQEDAVALANLFGKAMMGQTGALKRAGISFTDAQAEVLKYGTEEEKAAMIAEVVTQNVGKMNKKFAKTDAGKIQQAKNQLGDMGEEIGAVLLPAVADLVKWFQKNLMPKMEKLIKYFKQHPLIAKFALAFAAITAAAGPLLIFIGKLITSVGKIITIIPKLGAVFTALTGPVGIAVAAIAAAIAIGITLYKNWDTIKAKAKTIWNAIKVAIETPIKALKTSLTNTWNAIKSAASTAWNAVKNAITSPITSAKNTISSIVSGIKKLFPVSLGTILKGISTSPLSSAFNTIKSIAKKIKNYFPLSIGKIFKGIKLPKIHVSGGKAPFGIAGKGSLPKFSVTWNKKAMQQPYMFSNPTLFGAGEAGDEMLYGRKALMRDIAAAVGGGGDTIVNVYGSDNMSVNELANAVERKLVMMQKQRNTVWA